MATEVQEQPATGAGNARKASNANSDDLAPLPTNLTTQAHHGRRASRVLRPGVGMRGRLGTLAGNHLGIGDMHPRVQLENTYRMRPEPVNKFNCAQVRDVVQSLLESHLQGECYNQNKSKAACSKLADAIRRDLKDLDSKRYKLVISVYIVQQLGQGAMLASRAIGNEDTDNFVNVQFSAKDFLCSAVVHGLYFE